MAECIKCREIETHILDAILAIEEVKSVDASRIAKKRYFALDRAVKGLKESLAMRVDNSNGGSHGHRTL